MPYIDGDKQEFIENEINALVDKVMKMDSFEENRSGTLNYIITRLGLELKGKTCYKNLSEIEIAMIDAANEWYRIQMVPYEDSKIKQVGPILTRKERELKKQKYKNGGEGWWYRFLIFKH